MNLVERGWVEILLIRAQIRGPRPSFRPSFRQRGGAKVPPNCPNSTVCLQNATFMEGVGG
jgi:hypothetical protein